MLLFPINFNDIRPVTVVVISRLVYRKGMDLLVAIIPRICAMHRNVRFIIGLEIRPPHPVIWLNGSFYNYGSAGFISARWRRA